MIALYAGAFLTPPQVHYLDGPLLGNGTMFLLTFIMNRGRWKKLEKKRQKAAENNFTDNQLVKIIPVPDTPALPSNPVLHMQRRWLITYIVGFFGSIFLIGLGIVMYAASQSVIQDLIHHGQSPYWALCNILFDASTLGLSTVLFICWLVYTPRQQITALQHGLAYCCGSHAGSIFWHEAKLFAVIGSTGETLTFELSSHSAVIHWSTKPVSFGLAHANITEEKYQQQVQALNALIAAKTGLPLYDLR